MVITRDVVSIPPVSDKMLEDGIGYIKVDALTKGKAQEIAAKIKSLEKSGAKKLVLDLRNTSDGEESEGIATANLFLNHGTITYLQGTEVSARGVQCGSGESRDYASGGRAGEQRNGWGG